MKRMLLGIFLMLCGIWCLIFGEGNIFFDAAAIILALFALAYFGSGFHTKEPEKRDKGD